MSTPRAVPSAPRPMSCDLTGKARIRQAALQLFASKGYAQASLRRIAQRAGVSLALIGHHFGSKVLLREAVDGWLLRTLTEAAVPGLDPRAPLSEAAMQLASGYEAVLAVEPDSRAYLRRAVLDDARGEGQVIALFLAQTQQLLRGADSVSRPADPQELRRWTARVFVHVFGPLVLESALQRNEALVAEWETTGGTAGEALRSQGVVSWPPPTLVHRLPRYIDAGVSPSSRLVAL